MGHWGEEKFLTVTRQFYHDSHGDLIIYCIDDRSSFDKVNSWIIDLKNNVPEILLLWLLENKSDLNYNRKVESNQKILMRKYLINYSVKYHPKLLL